MVGRLVQQENIRIAEEQAGQFGAHDPAAAELAHIACEVGFLETQARQDGFRLVVAVVAPGCLQLALKGCQVIHQRVLFRSCRT